MTSPSAASERVEQLCIAQALAMMRQALERLPAEREAIKTAPLRERQYRAGLCDGMEETIDALSSCFRPLLPSAPESAS